MLLNLFYIFTLNGLKTHNNKVKHFIAPFKYINIPSKSKNIDSIKKYEHGFIKWFIEWVLYLI